MRSENVLVRKLTRKDVLHYKTIKVDTNMKQKSIVQMCEERYKTTQAREIAAHVSKCNQLYLRLNTKVPYISAGYTTSWQKGKTQYFPVGSFVSCLKISKNNVTRLYLLSKNRTIIHRYTVEEPQVITERVMELLK